MEQPFEIISERVREYRRFNASGTQITARLKPPSIIEPEAESDLEASPVSEPEAQSENEPEPKSSSVYDPVNHFLDSVNALFNYALENVRASDMVGVTIRNEDNQADKAIGFSFRRRDQIAGDVIWSLFEKVSQSNARFNALDKLVVEVQVVKMPVGFGRNKNALTTKGRPVSELAHLKRSIVRVEAEENCLAHALIIAIAKLTNDSNYKAYRQGRKIAPVVQHLLQTTGINLTNGGSIPELTQFQDHFAEYRIVVYDGLHCNEIMFDGQTNSAKRINLLYDDVTKHYHVINSLTGAMAKRYVCKACNKGCVEGTRHTCDQTCSDCLASPPCDASGVRIPCNECNRHFRSQTCFNNHKQQSKANQKSVCQSKRCCETCRGLINRRRKHECNMRFCSTCRQNKEIGHLCYMKPVEDVVTASDKVLFVFYDFETTQDTRISDTATQHVPNLVCIQQFCSECENVEDIEQDCPRCGTRKHTFWEADPVGDLLSYLCERRPWVNKVIAIAHNAKAYDLHFILNRAILLKWTPDLIMNGLKIMSMRFEHMIFLDSVCYMPLPLRKLPDAFGLSATKSWYPHFFNTAQNRNYIGPIPDVTMYGVDEMSEAERIEFLTWYKGQADNVFDNRQVLESYCQDDVAVLRQACQIFRRELMTVGHIDVFLESITIASACNKVFRKRFLKPDIIGLIPTSGYTGNVNYSKKSIMWLTHVERSNNCTIIHGRRGREHRLPELPHLSVDGYCPITKKVYEFLGCYFHGHTCMPFRDIETLGGDTLSERYEQTMARLEQITGAGYEVETMWECQFEQDILAHHPELETLPALQQSPLNTRDALYGGRTEAMRLHYKVRDGESIQYVDVMSLYPYICKYFKFPVGHPTIYIGDECRDIAAMLQKEGLIKCLIMPPKQLYHPVLPFKCNNKLLFCLCRSCAIEMNGANECTHDTVRERALVGTWVIDEVRLAVSKGYRIVKVYEVYEYAVTQYDRQGDEGGLFVEYINTFLKLKAEASGYPVWVSSSEDEDRFINAFYMSEGILLDKNEIRPNAAKRALAKLCLNSFWGKLTEKNNRTKSKMITDPRELYRFLVTPGIEVVNLMFASDQVCWASWRYAEDEKIPNLRHTNEVIGAYVTTGARIHLYKYLDKLQERALYCDTDSVLYIQDDDKPALIQCGDNLGDMTNELKPNEFIHEFVSGGPKNYAYKISNRDASKEPKTVCKVRGITLNYTAIQVVKFDVLKQMILRGEPDVVMVHTEKKIKRKRKLEGCVSIITEPEDKMYRISFFKRRRLADNTSLPFGYK